MKTEILEFIKDNNGLSLLEAWEKFNDDHAAYNWLCHWVHCGYLEIKNNSLYITFDGLKYLAKDSK